MNNPKKPEAVAKTAKKLGRPLGSKSKTKTVPATSNVDWEKLCKNLQAALAAEMRYTDQFTNANFWQRLKYAFTGLV